MKKLVVVKQHIEKRLNEETGQTVSEVMNIEFVVKEEETVIFGGNTNVNGLSLYSQNGQSKLDINNVLELIKIATDATEIVELK